MWWMYFKMSPISWYFWIQCGASCLCLAFLGWAIYDVELFQWKQVLMEYTFIFLVIHIALPSIILPALSSMPNVTDTGDHVSVWFWQNRHNCGLVISISTLVRLSPSRMMILVPCVLSTHGWEQPSIDYGNNYLSSVMGVSWAHFCHDRSRYASFRPSCHSAGWFCRVEDCGVTILVPNCEGIWDGTMQMPNVRVPQTCKRKVNVESPSDNLNKNPVLRSSKPSLITSGVTESI